MEIFCQIRNPPFLVPTSSLIIETGIIAPYMVRRTTDGAGSSSRRDRMTKLTKRTATVAVDLLRRGEASPLEVIDAAAFEPQDDAIATYSGKKATAASAAISPSQIITKGSEL
jgi:hypothetical protein